MHVPEGASGPTFLIGDAACGRPFWLGSTLNGHLVDLAELVGSTSCWNAWEWREHGTAPFKPFLERCQLGLHNGEMSKSAQRRRSLARRGGVRATSMGWGPG